MLELSNVSSLHCYSNQWWLRCYAFRFIVHGWEIMHQITSILFDQRALLNLSFDSFHWQKKLHHFNERKSSFKSTNSLSMFIFVFVLKSVKNIKCTNTFEMNSWDDFKTIRNVNKTEWLSNYEETFSHWLFIWVDERSTNWLSFRDFISINRRLLHRCCCWFKE